MGVKRQRVNVVELVGAKGDKGDKGLDGLTIINPASSTFPKVLFNKMILPVAGEWKNVLSNNGLLQTGVYVGDLKLHTVNEGGNAYFGIFSFVFPISTFYSGQNIIKEIPVIQNAHYCPADYIKIRLKNKSSSHPTYFYSEIEVCCIESLTAPTNFEFNFTRIS